VASSLEPDILIIDEVLAVGDFSFRKKCYERISQLLSRSAVIFVSHQIDQLKRLCNKGLLLDRGRVFKTGQIFEVATAYEEEMAKKNEIALENYFSESIPNGTVEVSATEITFKGNIDILFKLKTSQKLENLIFRIAFVAINGDIVAEWSSRNAGEFDVEYGDNYIRGVIKIRKIPLKPANYKLSFMVNDFENKHYLAVIKRNLWVKIKGENFMTHYVQLSSE
jgi:lipopolysaccharide transport system ATP-binding protein